MIDLVKFAECINDGGHKYSPAQVENGDTVVRVCNNCQYSDVLLYTGPAAEGPGTGLEETTNDNAYV